MGPWYGQFNCPGLIIQPFNILVRNGGVAPITTIKGGVLINGQEYSQTYTPGNGLRRPIPPGTIDTLKVSIPSLPFGTYNMRFFVNMTNDAQAANDSISYTYNIRPHAMGERIDFDTVNVNPPNFSFLTEAGRPYIEGWYFSTYDTANINRSGNSFFVDNQRGAFYLSTWANARNGYLEFRTRPFGPLSANAHFSLDISVFATILRASDTIYIEASDDCGQTYRRLETISRANQDEFISTLNVDQIQPPPTKRFPIPFLEGSHVHIRLLYRWPAGLPFSRITADNMWVGVPTDINQNIDTHNRLEVWPNPAGQVIYTKLPAGEQMEALQVLDMQGKVLKTQSSGLHIKLQDFNQGTYMARMVTNKGVRYARFVKE
jgi:hypothetical protein